MLLESKGSPSYFHVLWHSIYHIRLPPSLDPCFDLSSASCSCFCWLLSSDTLCLTYRRRAVPLVSLARKTAYCHHDCKSMPSITSNKSGLSDVSSLNVWPAESLRAILSSKRCGFYREKILDGCLRWRCGCLEILHLTRNPSLD